jgi:hypothetical protein
MRLVRASVALAIALLGCRPQDEADLLPPISTAVPEPPAILQVEADPGGLAHFGPGWWETEHEPGRIFRWMRQMGELVLPTYPAGARLSFRGHIAANLYAAPPLLTVFVNDHVLDRFPAPGSPFSKDYAVPTGVLGTAPTCVVRLQISQIVRADRDPRDLGFAIDGVAWRPEHSR